MARALRVLHITPHLGGGVGRALVSLAEGDPIGPARQPIERQVLCLEPPQKTGAWQRLLELGVQVRTSAGEADLRHAAGAADLVQCEVWNHPRLFEAWHQLRGLSLRMTHWCHVSGLGFPKLPDALWHNDQPVALTAACSLRSSTQGLQTAHRSGKVHVISSAAGFEKWPALGRRAVSWHHELRLGYVGSLQLAKMHPHYVQWLVKALPEPSTPVSVEVLGDVIEPGALARQCEQHGRPGLVKALGFRSDVATAMSAWQGFLYLLNPHHYGTAEIALIEAMASGLVPIILPNACEADLVADGIHGWHVDSPAALRQTLARMAADAHERSRMGDAASDWVRHTFTTGRLTRAFASLYEQTMATSPQTWDVTPWMGTHPWQWFQATLPAGHDFEVDAPPRLPMDDAGHAHRERTKGSVHHFASCFPQDRVLRAWSQHVSQASGSPQPVDLAAA